MKLYSRYILTKLIISFLGVISILVSLIWFSRTVTFIRYVTENGVGLREFFSLFILILPWLLLLIIPISLFVAILLVYNRLIIYNEITILKNSGLTKFAISNPVFFVAVISSVFCFIISFYLMPYANKKLRLSRIDFRNNYASLSFKPQTFENINNLTIYAKGRDVENNLYGILLNDERSQYYSITVTAKKGNVEMEDSSALLYMEDGTVQRFNYETKKTEILNFDNYVFNLTETQTADTGMRWRANERYLNELLNPDTATEADRKIYHAEIHRRFTSPLLPIIFSLIALSAILRGGFSRSGNTKNITIAVFVTTIFFVINFISYDLIESSPAFTPVLYLNIVLFSLASTRTLTTNYRKK